MVYGDHIAITSGDKSTTGREVSVRDAPLLPGGERELKRSSPLTTDGNLSGRNRDINTYLILFTTILRLKPLVYHPRSEVFALGDYVVTVDRRSH